MLQQCPRVEFDVAPQDDGADASPSAHRVVLELWHHAGAKQHVLVHHFLDLVGQGLYDGSELACDSPGSFRLGIGPAPASSFTLVGGTTVPRNASGMPAPKALPNLPAPSAATVAMMPTPSTLPPYTVFFDPKEPSAQLRIATGAATDGSVPSEVLQRAVALGRVVVGLDALCRGPLSLRSVTASPYSARPLPRLEMETSLGTIAIALLVQYAPVTCSNIIDLARAGFYDGQHIHRVVNGFVAQLGCPNSTDPKSRQWGSGGPAPNSTFPLLPTMHGEADATDAPVESPTMVKRSAQGKIDDEYVSCITNSKYTVAMANSGSPNTGGSQFFINLAANAKLDWFNTATTSSHVVFGVVDGGFDVVDAIGLVKTNASTDRPVVPILVKRVSVVL